MDLERCKGISEVISITTVEPAPYPAPSQPPAAFSIDPSQARAAAGAKGWLSLQGTLQLLKIANLKLIHSTKSIVGRYKLSEPC